MMMSVFDTRKSMHFRGIVPLRDIAFSVGGADIDRVRVRCIFRLFVVVGVVPEASVVSRMLGSYRILPRSFLCNIGYVLKIFEAGLLTCVYVLFYEFGKYCLVMRSVSKSFLLQQLCNEVDGTTSVMTLFDLYRLVCLFSFFFAVRKRSVFHLHCFFGWCNSVVYR